MFFWWPRHVDFTRCPSQRSFGRIFDVVENPIVFTEKKETLIDRIFLFSNSTSESLNEKEKSQLTSKEKVIVCFVIDHFHRMFLGAK